MKNTKDLDISVIIATYNRDSVLGETLAYMVQMQRTGINSEFVVVDNNSTDKTRQIVEEFAEQLPIRYLFEAKPGQNCARNRALNQSQLGDIVAFTDDDVVPDKDWLQAIVSTCRKWPNCGVFGGKIYVVWPGGQIPKWARMPDIRSLAFAEHDYGQSECIYTAGAYPFSGNFWVRRRILANAIKFDESIGWRPGNRILATETSLLRKLADKGERFLYSPGAVVGHRVTSEQLSLKYLMSRAYSRGRGLAHLQQLCRKDLFQRHPLLWRFVRAGAIGRLGFSLGISSVPLVFNRPEKATLAMRRIGYNIESLKLAGTYYGAT